VTEQYKGDQELLAAHQPALKILAQQMTKHETMSSSIVKEALENSSCPGLAADYAHMEELHVEVSGSG
jgi:hypothetical protein